MPKTLFLLTSLALFLPVSAAFGEFSFEVSTGISKSVEVGRADIVHDYGFTGDGINVAILDTGVASSHPELTDAIVAEACFCDRCCPNGRGEGQGKAEDEHGHGTAMAGIITSPTGVAPDAGIVAVKVMNSQGKGNFLDLGAALQWVLFNHRRFNIRVVNLSLSDEKSYNEYRECSGPLFDIISDTVGDLLEEGVITFAASGNSAFRGVSFPACSPATIAVGATYNKDFSGGANWGICWDMGPKVDDVPCFTNMGPLLDFVAPYSSVLVRLGGRGGEYFGGTSSSAAYASGAAALLLQANPSLPFETILHAMQNQGPIAKDFASRGLFRRLDVEKALIAVPEPEVSLALPFCLGMLFLFNKGRRSF